MKAPTRANAGVSLVASTLDLVIEKKHRDGVPLLLVDGRLEPVPSLYLSRRSQSSVRTAWTYGRALMRWWQRLASRGVQWWKVSISDIEEFVLGRSRATARLEMAAVAGFYGWAYEHGWIEHRPFLVLGRTARRPFEAGAAVPAVRLPRSPRRQPKLISRPDFNAVLAASDRRDPGLLLRDELTAECGHYIGLRRLQVRGLTVGQFEFEDLDSIAYVVDLDPVFSKGEKDYPVIVPRQLVHKVRKYITTARARIIERCKERSVQFREPPELFLTNKGTPMSEANISTTWRRAARRAGVKARFHANRHAAATGVAAGALRFGIQPLRTVMAQLGHAREKSSAGYTHLAELARELQARAHVMNDRWDQDHAV